MVARARLTVDLVGPFADFRDKGFTVFFRELFVTRGLFLITIQSDISKAFAESIHLFSAIGLNPDVVAQPHP